MACFIAIAVDACPAERLIWKDDAWWLSLRNGWAIVWVGNAPGREGKLGDELTPEEGAIFTVGDYVCGRRFAI